MIMNKIILKATNLHWITDNPVEQTQDLCAHGFVEFKINDSSFLKPEPNIDITVSAAALFLLRTLEKSHTPVSSVCEHNLLFPCCAHSMWLINGEFTLGGCDKWFNPQVLKHNDFVMIKGAQGIEETVTAQEWQTAVFKFADEVKAFYDSSDAKVIPEEELERKGYEWFWKEWKERRMLQN